MNRPAFLVDGFTEKLVLERICPNTKINRINCNGNSVSLEAIAKRIATLVRLLNNRHYPIIVILDREERELSVPQMEQNLIEEIRKVGIADDIRIGVCDRMIENWILSDWESFSESCIAQILQKPENTDGIKGKSFIKKCYPEYQETTDGVNMLLRSNPKTMYANSDSFRKFANQIVDINCEWLQTLL